MGLNIQSFADSDYWFFENFSFEENNLCRWYLIHEFDGGVELAKSTKLLN